MSDGWRTRKAGNDFSPANANLPICALQSANREIGVPGNHRFCDGDGCLRHRKCPADWQTWTDTLNPFIEFDRFCNGRYLAFLLVLRESLSKAATQKLMYLKCAHPDCSSDFDYGQGRLFRFQQTPQQEKQASHWHAVKHYWLCTRCCESYTIEYQKGMGILLLERLEKLTGAQPCYYVLQAEITPKPALPRRLALSRARQRKQKSELNSATVNAMEVLENRNLERRG
jgi:hypothetical protein